MVGQLITVLTAALLVDLVTLLGDKHSHVELLLYIFYSEANFLCVHNNPLCESAKTSHTLNFEGQERSVLCFTSFLFGTVYLDGSQ
jgi:hypothetical protein